MSASDQAVYDDFPAAVSIARDNLMGAPSFDARRRTLVLVSDAAHAHADVHERRTRAVFARRLAAFMGASDGGEYAPGLSYEGALYVVPGATLLSAEAAKLGVTGEDDIFGGVAPSSFVATKVISHPLLSPSSSAPPGWSQAFGEAIAGVVLDGVSAFAREDAWLAGLRLLENGPVRLKPPGASAGRDQVVISSPEALHRQLAAIDDARFEREGLVLEENLVDVETYSVGQVRVAGRIASYWGVQRLTRDNSGMEVYGGSDLLVANGGYAELLAHPHLPERARTAVRQGKIYDEAAMRLFPGLFVSRRNYDLVRGVNAQGQARAGVLEQSWRMGGASGAELAALEAFRDNEDLAFVRASTYEAYGSGRPPPDAVVYFEGEDPRIGPISKYTLVHAS